MSTVGLLVPCSVTVADQERRVRAGCPVWLGGVGIDVHVAEDVAIDPVTEFGW